MIPSKISIQFTASNWSEVAFHEHADAGKLSRASISNTLSGELTGEGVLEYLLSYTNDRDVAFMGYERIMGKIAGYEGSFVLRHDGVFSSTEGVSGTLSIEAGSGTADFSGLTGNGKIQAKAGEHGGIYTLQLSSVPMEK
ncbi:DUF3224 domain-containing protein [Iodobacter fluviatilis]|uniref:Protein of uncharacterized function (DUF3224) n=1 Tax=Iodobacter fluviatilis TaxID=537 RepID=A0A377QAM0_9NEIS|nr:DUF3224 domain-containing protein [Iodobacter fluviatilis]TCU82414.1 uncharacterized protein DUF3224 [Iodobacter fluviatilis]STQ91639.1 Protein of uncharacterised function (DUF3224) [Iodobacter fluviatilis]